MRLMSTCSIRLVSTSTTRSGSFKITSISICFLIERRLQAYSSFQRDRVRRLFKLRSEILLRFAISSTNFNRPSFCGEDGIDAEFEVFKSHKEFSGDTLCRELANIFFNVADRRDKPQVHDLVCHYQRPLPCFAFCLVEGFVHVPKMLGACIFLPSGMRLPTAAQQNSVRSLCAVAISDSPSGETSLHDTIPSRASTVNESFLNKVPVTAFLATRSSNHFAAVHFIRRMPRIYKLEIFWRYWYCFPFPDAFHGKVNVVKAFAERL